MTDELNVVGLDGKVHTAEFVPDEDLLRKLAEAMEEARRGRLRSVVIVGQLDDGQSAAFWHVPAKASRPLLLGALARVSHHINQAMDEED